MIGPSPAHTIGSLTALRRNGPWARRCYWLPEGWTVSTPSSMRAADECRSWRWRTATRTAVERHRAALARAAEKRARKAARQLALRDAEVRRADEREAHRVAAMLRSAGVGV